MTAIDSGGNPTAGVQLASGSNAWSVLSDRGSKEHIETVDVRDALRRVAAMPLSTWNYITEGSGIRHMGPMAQDFRAAFGLGDGSTRISTVDADGVALAAIQGLHLELRDRDLTIAKQAELLQALAARVEQLEQRASVSP